MCGRFTVTTSKFANWQTAFPRLIATHWLGPRFNVAPTQPVPAVLNTKPDHVQWIRWGLIPHWAKDAAIGNKLINARAETLREKPAFRRAFEKQRCLVLADGFFEWVTIPGTKTKKPYYIHLKSGAPFAFAGLWDRWTGPDGEIVSCTVITTTPNEVVAPIHNRMPVILPSAAHDRWLGDATPPRDLLIPFTAAPMTAEPVSTVVNSPMHDVPACIAPQATDRELF